LDCSRAAQDASEQPITAQLCEKLRRQLAMRHLTCMSSVAVKPATNSAQQTETSSNSRGLRPYSHVLAVFFCGAFAFLDLYCTQPLLPLLAHVFHASEVHVGLTISASTVGVAVSSALLALFGERFPRKRTILTSMLALGIAALLTATATSLNMLAFWRLLQGLVTPGIFILTIAYITEEWPALLVPRVMSAYVAGTVFGGFTGRFLGGTIAAHFGWRPMFLVLGTGGLIGTALTLRMLKPPTMQHTPKTVASPFTPVLNNLRNPRLAATFGIGFCMLFTLISIFSFITFHLTAAPFNLSTQQLSYLFAVYLFGLAATLAAGTVLAKIGLRHGMLGAVGLCITGTLLTLVPSLIVVAIGLSLASSGIFIAQTCANSFLRDAAAAGARVSAAGMYICSYYIGGTVGGVLPGIAYKLAGWPGCVALTCSLLVVAGLLAIVYWPSHSARPDPIPL
jgi:predicted MFS family arabinose efflux permease